MPVVPNVFRGQNLWLMSTYRAFVPGLQDEMQAQTYFETNISSRPVLLGINSRLMKNCRRYRRQRRWVDAAMRVYRCGFVGMISA